MRREYKRAWSWTVEGRGGAKGRGDARQGEEEETCLLVRKKEESGASTCIFHSFAILSIRGGIRSGEKSKKGRKKKKKGKKEVVERRDGGPSSSTTILLFSPQYEWPPFQQLTTWKLDHLPAHFCEPLFFRNAGPTIVFPPFRHYVHPASVPFLQSGRVI